MDNNTKVGAELPPMRSQAASHMANDMIAGSVKSPDWLENVRRLQEAQRRGEYEPPMRTASARIKGDKDRENPVERPQPLETGSDLSNELVELAYQYLSDLRYPPFGDSKDRRIERIKTVLEAVEKVRML